MWLKQATRRNDLTTDQKLDFIETVAGLVGEGNF
jgi:hypothetical protein